MPLERARTLPGRWYADPTHHERELTAMFRRRLGRRRLRRRRRRARVVRGDDRRRCCPVLVTRDDAGTLRAFLNVCRHRGSPLADGCGHARALSCPYHGWVYRLDGSLARAGGVGRPAGFDPADHGLRPVPGHDVRPVGLVNLDPAAAPFDPGPLAAGLEPYRLDEMELGERTRYERHFNWKVLLENYCENYHTPFIHSQLPTSGYEYPIEWPGRP